MDNKDKNKDNKKILTIAVLIVTLILCETGATYAFFAISATNNVASGTTATTSLTLTVTQASLKSGNTGVMVPQYESALGTAMNGTNKCVDANNNIVCKVYTVNVTNGSSAAVRVKGTIQFSGNESMPNLKWRRTTNATTLGNYTSVAVGNNTTNKYDLSAGSVCTTSSGTDTGCTAVTIAAGASTPFYFVVWINETGSAQTDSGTWVGTVTFEGENGTGVTSTIK